MRFIWPTLLLAAAGCALLPASAVAGTLVFSSYRDTPYYPPQQSIWRIQDDGTGMQRLTWPSQGDHRELDSFPSWSPDGQWVAYTRESDPARDAGLWVMRADGSGATRLVSEQQQNIGPVLWSPNGNGFFFTRTYPGSFFAPPRDGGIYFLPLDGSGERLIVADLLSDAQMPVISSDGKHLIFYRAEGWYSAALDGSDQRRLTIGSAPLLNYSPNGDYMAYTVDGELWTMKADGTQIVRRAGPEALPRDRLEWSTESPTLFFVASSELQGFPHPSVLIQRLDVSDPRSQPRYVTPPTGYEFEFDWTAGPGPSTTPRPDTQAPVVLVTDSAGRPRRSLTGRDTTVLTPGKDRLLASDPSGVKGVSFALAKRVPRKGRRRGSGYLCRFLNGKHLGRRQRCSRPRFVRVRGAGDLDRMLQVVVPGTYRYAFRTTDFLGNTTRRAPLKTLIIR